MVTYVKLKYLKNGIEVSIDHPSLFLGHIEEANPKYLTFALNSDVNEQFSTTYIKRIIRIKRPLNQLIEGAAEIKCRTTINF